MTERDWYAERDPGDADHPVDVEVRERVARAPRFDELRATIDETRRAIRSGLGRRASLWVELEALLNARAALREAAYYNLGVDHGRSLGATERMLDEVESDSEHGLRVLEELAQRLAAIARAVREGRADGSAR